LTIEWSGFVDQLGVPKSCFNGTYVFDRESNGCYRLIEGCEYNDPFRGFYKAVAAGSFSSAFLPDIGVYTITYSATVGFSRDSEDCGGPGGCEPVECFAGTPPGNAVTIGGIHYSQECETWGQFFQRVQVLTVFLGFPNSGASSTLYFSQTQHA
jgi:hypothetical protein